MSTVRKIDCGNVAVEDFAPSEMFLVILDKDHIETLCQSILRWDCDKEHGLLRILNSSFRLLDEVMA